MLLAPTWHVPVAASALLSLLAMAPAAAQWRCPLHPGLRQTGAGECPVCGLPLAIDRSQGDSSAGAPAVPPDAHPSALKAPTAAATPGPRPGSVSLPDAAQLYTCGMHPQIIRPAPGLCPLCHMELTPIRSGAGLSEAGAPSVVIDPRVVQQIGVRVAPVERRDLTRSLRTIGEIEIAEDEVSVVNLRFGGWVEQLFVSRTGQAVRAGEPLFAIYSPELVTAQHEYLLALAQGGAQGSLARATAQNLLARGVEPALVAALQASGSVQRVVTVRAPRAGYVLDKGIVQGSAVEAGRDLYRIGNLRTIWVRAQVYEFDAPWIAVGQAATMELSFARGRRWEGRVGFIYPTIATSSRTLAVRLEFPNPGLQLRPGMFATVRIAAQTRPASLALPKEAVLYGGESQLVFVAGATLGSYSPRAVSTGLSSDDGYLEVLAGLAEGELVVTSGQFLLDAESQLQAAVRRFTDQGLQRPPPGMDDGHVPHQH